MKDTLPKKRKPPFTPRSQIKAALHKLWLESRERREALFRTSYCCAKCRRKASKAKGREFRIEVHHLDGVDWGALVDLVRERLLPSPDRLMPLCHEDHQIVEAEIRAKLWRPETTPDTPQPRSASQPQTPPGHTYRPTDASHPNQDAVAPTAAWTTPTPPRRPARPPTPSPARRSRRS